MKKAMGFLLVSLLLANTASAQECRQPVSKTANPAVDLVLVGGTAGIDLATRGRTWGGWSQTGRVAETVIWTRSNERINSRQADSADYATCKNAETTQVISANSTAAEVYRTASEYGTSGTVSVQKGQISADVRQNKGNANRGTNERDYAPRKP